ncbi:uncharacterized protein LOC128994676 isoform X3 [Macrosteles quadrilineatus]|uniref:uncharacterized protein LOC128994676 isoform X3 n=1 Tax=Macrosteles quadrilineatus TaxID=74068 RepID=UPI0023E13C5D|nr:uncharacterized protein LOC128994676 isoform X3 [Macrosteles quadrilineatus]
MYVIFPAEDLVELTLSRPPVDQSHQNSRRGSPSCPTPGGPPSPSRSPKIPPKPKKDKNSSQSQKKFLQKQEQYDRNVKMAAAGEGTLRDLSHPSLNDQLKNHNAVTFKLVRTVSDFTQELSQMYEQHAEELQLLVANFRKKNAELRKERPACPSSLFHTWETLLQEVEVDSQAHSDIASVFGRQVSRPLLERSFHRKVQARKVFAHRESFELVVNKAEEKLAKARQDYKASYLGHMASPSNTATLAAYLDAHNNYVTQLHATNGMVDTYSQETLPLLLQELEEVYSDLCTTLSDSLQQGAEVISSRATEQSRRYEVLSNQCRAVSPTTDLAHFVRSLAPLPPQAHPSHRLRVFTPPQPPQQDTQADPSMADGPPINDLNAPAPLKNEVVVDRLASIQVRSRYEALRVEAVELETQIKQLQDALDTMVRIQQRSLESQLYNKVNELQEDISIKRFDLRTAQIHLAAVRAQKELFASKLDSAEGASGRDRKMSSSSTGSMKSKWLKAFKSLKTTSGPSNGTSPKEGEKKNGRDSGLNLGLESAAHQFQEYTYKKITPCDVCSQVLRGHTRQGLKCRVCKLNVHLDCQEKVGRCQAKSRLLRRQKSTSEIETRVTPAQEEEAVTLVANRPGRSSVSPAGVTQGGSPSTRSVTWKNPPSRSLASSEQASPGEVDAVYQVLKQATEISSTRNPPARRVQQGPPLMLRGASTLTVGPTPHASSSVRHYLRYSGSTISGTYSSATTPTEPQMNSPIIQTAPHSPRRQKLNLRMKSLSLDSPESSEVVQRRRGGPPPSASANGGPTSSHSSSSRLQSPSSPVHNRRLLSARNMRMSSVELPDDNEKSLSSASTSPCPSPKPHRLLPTNLYVVLYNFKSRHADELDLKAGYKVTVIDTSDQDWWKGKCLGRIGYFPSKYVTKLGVGEKPLQVTHNLQVSDGDNGLTLLRDQIVIQIGEELDGMVVIRNGDNRQGVCPLKFLQEV